MKCPECNAELEWDYDDRYKCPECYNYLRTDIFIDHRNASDMIEELKVLK